MAADEDDFDWMEAAPEPPEPNAETLPEPFALAQLLPLEGAPPTDGADGYTLGMVRASLAGAFANIPHCDGSLVDSADRPVLRWVLGETFGGGNSRASAIPRLAGRVVVGATEAMPPGTVDRERHAIAMRYLVCVEGLGPDVLSPPDAPLIGQVVPYAGGPVPRGWMAAEGQLLPIRGNERLYSYVGNGFGGDGMTRFALPDLRGRVAVGSGRLASGRSIEVGERIDAAADGIPALALGFHLIHSGAWLAPDADRLDQPFVGEVMMLAARARVEAGVPLDGRRLIARSSGMLANVLEVRADPATGGVIDLPDLAGRALAGVAEARVAAARTGGFG